MPPLSFFMIDDGNLNEGHRARLRKRFQDGGGNAVPDYELLELILFRSIPRRDVKPLAKKLIAHFGSFAETMGASLERLMEVGGVGASTALDIKIVATAGQRMAKGEISTREVLSSFSKLIEYCRITMAFEEREALRVLFLDKRNGLIADEILHTGTVDHTPVYPREIIRRALELASTALILVHNHPSGDPTPSASDIAMTQDVITTAKPLGIAVHDHVIIGRQGHASFRSLGLI